MSHEGCDDKTCRTCYMLEDMELVHLKILCKIRTFQLLILDPNEFGLVFSKKTLSKNEIKSKCTFDINSAFLASNNSL